MKKFVCIIIALILILSGCTAPAYDKLIVAVGIVPEAAFVSKVAGDLADVVTMIPAGNSPANYAPSASEMQALSDAAVYFTLQMPTEEANILPKVRDFNDDIEIVNLRDAVAAAYPLLTADGNTSPDPHVWLSPKRAAVMVQVIADTLADIDADNSDVYHQNAADYIAELEALDQEIQQTAANLANKSFLIYHAAYAYFADDYGLDMVAIETAGKEASAAEIQDVIDFACGSGIEAVFYQEEFDDSQAQTIADEIGGRVIKAAPLSYDYIQELKRFADALGGQ